jgi:predicted transcriptional regulator
MSEVSREPGADLLIELTAEIVAAYVSNNSVAANDLPNVISQVHAALGGAATPVEEVVESRRRQLPFVVRSRTIT